MQGLLSKHLESQESSVRCECQDCHEKHFAWRGEFDRAAPPRCVGCGGLLRPLTIYVRFAAGTGGREKRTRSLYERIAREVLNV